MTGIVERLRMTCADYFCNDCYGNLMNDAADRIEELEKINVELCRTHNSLLIHNSRMEDRIQELEKALKRITRGGTSVLLDATLNDDPINPNVLQEIINGARTALKEERK
jgi:hypothetical protein